MFQSIFGVPKSSSAAAVVQELLAEGVYWQSGEVEATPHTGQGWTAGLPGLSSGASVTMLRVVASAAKTQWTATARYQGNIITNDFKYWNGSAYATPTSIVAIPWGFNAVYATDPNGPNTFDSTVSTAWILKLTESVTVGGNIQGDAFAVA
jgi:hypothetical protein